MHLVMVAYHEFTIWSYKGSILNLSVIIVTLSDEGLRLSVLPNRSEKTPQLPVPCKLHIKIRKGNLGLRRALRIIKISLGQSDVE